MNSNADPEPDRSHDMPYTALHVPKTKCGQESVRSMPDAARVSRKPRPRLALMTTG